ncbi:MAG: GNAT family protein [Phycisphaerae bacterium]|nr:GNAT family protein [Phycisphaerae bacterium]
MATLTRVSPAARCRSGSSAVTDPPARVVFYEGHRIYFSPIEPEDEPLLRRFINDPANWRGLMHRGPVNSCREQEWVESLGRDGKDYAFGIVVRQDDRLIGVAGLINISAVNRSANFGINIGDPAFQNKGYGTEATLLCLRYGFEELNLNRIALSVFSNNPRAIRCYQKAGFVQEGCLRRAVFRNGRYEDEYRFAVLRDEWERGQQR